MGQVLQERGRAEDFAMTPTATDSGRRSVDWLSVAGWAAVAATLVRALWFTPIEASQGAAQKIMYAHVPAAWVAFIAFFITAVTGIVYLFLRDERLDRFSAASPTASTSPTRACPKAGP